MGNTVKIDLAKLRERFAEAGAMTSEEAEKIVNLCVVKEEAVNHPKHYQGKHECIEVMRHLFGDSAVRGFCKCNAFKYRFRSRMKNGDEDIKKAEFYEDYLIQMNETSEKNINAF
ncbi:DUF3310 domain-containing protein [Treponema sp.]|uniref:DUF3310 domain-containing protein n=1 Tax=Treponema sp. TaxID=166 RepID=UPI00388D33AA